MEMEAIELGLLRTNCYILYDGATRDAVVIDPGYDGMRIKAHLDELDVTLRAIVLTHGHFDHVGGVSVLREATGCPVYLPKPDTKLPDSITGGAIAYTNLYGDGEALRFGAISLDAMLTPGHTPGSACLRAGSWLFTGDTLFRDACGRTDLALGDGQAMRRSLAALAQLAGDFYVYPGHGDATTLDRERKYNPCLLAVMRP